jgi:hypothetical protein
LWFSSDITTIYYKCGYQKITQSVEWFRIDRRSHQFVLFVLKVRETFLNELLVYNARAITYIRHFLELINEYRLVNEFLN